MAKFEISFSQTYFGTLDKSFSGRAVFVCIVRETLLGRRRRRWRSPTQPHRRATIKRGGCVRRHTDSVCVCVLFRMRGCAKYISAACVYFGVSVCTTITLARVDFCPPRARFFLLRCELMGDSSCLPHTHTTKCASRLAFQVCRRGMIVWDGIT